MKRLMSKMAAAALALSFTFGTCASASTTVSLAPVKPNTVIIIIGPQRVVIVTRPVAQSLEHVDQAAEFDRTN